MAQPLGNFVTSTRVGLRTANFLTRKKRDGRVATEFCQSIKARDGERISSEWANGVSRVRKKRWVFGRRKNEFSYPVKKRGCSIQATRMADRAVGV